MRFRSRPLLLAIVVGALLSVSSGMAHAAETASSELVIIREGDTVIGDLYATGVRVIIEGVVDGDLVAFAAEDVTISGEVTGSVLSVAPTVTVSGVIAGALRASANVLEVSGSIGTDLVSAVLSANLDSGSEVGGDVLLWAVNSKAAGTIGANLEGSQRTLELEGGVGGDVDVSVDRLTVTGPLEVAGTLGYRSGSSAEGLDHATVGGVVIHREPLPPNIRVRALSLLARLLAVVGLTGAAVLVAWTWPERTVRAGEKGRAQIPKAFGTGALVMLSPILLAGLAALIAGLVPASASLPLLAIFGPLILATAGIVFVLSLVAGVPAILTLGRLLPGERGLFGAIVLGSAIAGLVWLVPVIGWIVPVVILPTGLGGWLLSFREKPEPG
jgi:cytoskeletal protein CcmA (bactofilin family)